MYNSTMQVSETFQLLQPYNLHKCLKVTRICATSDAAQPCSVPGLLAELQSN